MKSQSWDEGLLAEHRASMADDTARAIFDVMVSLAESLPGYRTAPARQGEVRVFSYVDAASGERPYAFIVNQNDLLFYIRKTALHRVAGGLQALKANFPRAAENRAGEWTVRLSSPDEARRVAAFVFPAQVPDPPDPPLHASHHWWVNNKSSRSPVVAL